MYDETPVETKKLNNDAVYDETPQSNKKRTVFEKIDDTAPVFDQTPQHGSSLPKEVVFDETPKSQSFTSSFMAEFENSEIVKKIEGKATESKDRGEEEKIVSKPLFDLNNPDVDVDDHGNDPEADISQLIRENTLLRVDMKKDPTTPTLMPTTETSNTNVNKKKEKLTKMADVLVSAYEDKHVDMKDDVTTMEKNITSYLFAGMGNIW